MSIKECYTWCYVGFLNLPKSSSAEGKLDRGTCFCSCLPTKAGWRLGGADCVWFQMLGLGGVGSGAGGGSWALG